MNILKIIGKPIREIFDFIFGLFDSLFNEHKLVRRTIVFVALGLISWTVYTVIPKLEGSHAVTALISVIGILGTAIGFYQYLRGKDGD